MPLTELNFITSNPNKLSEVKAILGDTVPLKSQSLDLTEIQGSIEDISRDKCTRAANIVRIFWVEIFYFLFFYFFFFIFGGGGRGK